MLLMPGDGDVLHSAEGGDKRRGSCPVVRMARVAVEPQQPWAVRDDQAVTQEAAETVSQKGKGTQVGGWWRWYWELISPLGITGGAELATEGQGKGNVIFWSRKKFHLSLRRKMPRWEIAGEAQVGGCR